MKGSGPVKELIKMTTSVKKIEEFLEAFRKAVRKRGQIEFIERTSINKDLASLGITSAMATKEVKSLVAKDYQVGPQQDRDAHKFPNEKGDVWVFEKEINGKKAYIKLKLATSIHNEAIVFPKCWMHESIEPSKIEETAVKKSRSQKRGGKK